MNIDFYDIIFEQEYVTNQSEIITEKAVITYPGSFSLHVTPDSDQNLGENEGYFKWVNHESFSKADEIARIRYGSPTYAVHTDHHGKTTVRLSSPERKLLIKVLSKPVKPKQLLGISDDIIKLIDSGWKLMIYFYNKHCKFSDEDILEYANAEKEDIPKNMIRLSLPMPDYSLLPNKK